MTKETGVEDNLDPIEAMHYQLESLRGKIELPRFRRNDPISMAISILQADVSRTNRPPEYGDTKLGIIRSLWLDDREKSAFQLKRYYELEAKYNAIVPSLDELQLQALRVLAQSDDRRVLQFLEDLCIPRSTMHGEFYEQYSDPLDDIPAIEPPYEVIKYPNARGRLRLRLESSDEMVHGEINKAIDSLRDSLD